MTIAYGKLLSLRVDGINCAYNEKDAILYASSTGYGVDPLNSDELPFVLETRGLRTVPTMATILGRAPLVREMGVDYARVVHAEQKLVFHRPLGPAEVMIANTFVSEAFDKGVGKGALIYTTTDLFDAKDRKPIATHVTGIMARADGGFGGPTGSSRQRLSMPERPPDRSVRFTTRPDQALYYRLNGDRNPLHADPDVARRAGFGMPILHGLCTFGIAGRAIISAVCDYDETRIAAISARFAAPVYPGETITTDLWMDRGEVSFRCRVVERDVTTLEFGKCSLR